MKFIDFSDHSRHDSLRFLIIRDVVQVSGSLETWFIEVSKDPLPGSLKFRVIHDLIHSVVSVICQSLYPGCNLDI